MVGKKKIKKEKYVMDFYEAWHFLKNHPIFHDRFFEGMDIMVVKVDPKKKKVENNPERNTKTQIWLEHGPVRPNKTFLYSHDIDLDSGGDTFEDAIIALAERVKAKYGAGKR